VPNQMHGADVAGKPRGPMVRSSNRLAGHCIQPAMFSRVPVQWCLIGLAVVMAALAGSPSRAESFVSGWEDGSYAVPDQATWAAYYRNQAHLRLGPEQRLPNGVVWRLHVELASRLAMPRIVSMPDAQSVRTANGLLDMVHGGALLFAMHVRRQLDAENALRREEGEQPLEYDRPIIQTDVGLTYATPTLMSIVDLGVVPTDRRIAKRIIRGLTFDLRTGEMFRVEGCPGNEGGYGARSGDYRFRFGKLLQLCETETYLRFVQLLSARSVMATERSARSHDSRTAWCSETGGRVVAPHQEIVLYLTDRGLAVRNTEFGFIPARDNCVLERSTVNPLIIPYREVEPFMIPGPWRDELLKLK
jgi:hypothetical protein